MKESNEGMKKLVELMAAYLIASAVWAADSSGPPMFQIRAVLDAPSAESEPMSVVSKERKEVVTVEKAVLFDQTALKSAKVHLDRFGHPRIEITFSEKGRQRFADITRQNRGQRLAIIIDGQLYCAPRIMAEIPGGKAEISGSFSEQEAKDLAAKISDAVAKK